jgi:hypothetical protein
VKRWKSTAPPARHELMQLELLRDIRALLYINSLYAAGDQLGAGQRLAVLEVERLMEDV